MTGVFRGALKSRLIISEKALGWEYLLFANEVGIQAIISQEGLISESNKESGGHSYICIETATHAKSFCKTKLAWLDNIMQGMNGIAEINIPTQTKESSEKEALTFIYQAARDYIKPYLELNLWMKDVSCLSYSPRFNYLFSLLHEAPRNAIKNANNFYMSLYDNVYQHILDVRNGSPQTGSSWSIKIPGINSDIIHDELRRLTLLDAFLTKKTDEPVNVQSAIAEAAQDRNCSRPCQPHT